MTASLMMKNGISLTNTCMPQRLGQHFLHDASVLRRIAKTLDITQHDIVIEIGPGHGELTDALIKCNPRRLILIEKDPALAEALEKKYEAAKFVSIYRGDVRRDLAGVVAQEIPDGAVYKVAGNIPYYLTGFLLRSLGDLPRKPAAVVLTMQEEVARRLAEKPPRMNRLAASVQFWADPEVVTTIPASAFKPPPRVSSAVIRLAIKPAAMKPEQYFLFVHMAFSQPRKTLMNNLTPKGMSPEKKEKIHAALAALEVSPDARPQDLSIPELVDLAKRLGA